MTQNGTLAFVIITKTPDKWSDFVSFCNMWGYNVYITEEFNTVPYPVVKNATSVWYLTNEPEVVKSLGDNPRLLVIPLYIISNFVKFLEEYSFELVPMVEAKK